MIRNSKWYNNLLKNSPDHKHYLTMALKNVVAGMRLMSEKGKESQQDRYIRIKMQGLEVFDKEMKDHHLPQPMIDALHKYCDEYWGCVPIQEQMMEILMDENVAHFTLKEANDARKIVAKKQMERIPELKAKVYAAINDEMKADYIWEIAVAPQLGYAFSLNHSLPYSFVGIQTIILAIDFNPIYWNTACLIVNSGSLESEPEVIDESIEVDTEEETDDKSKKKIASTDYGKIAKAIGDIQSRGIKIGLADINISEFGFKPDAANNRILFGLKGMLNVGDNLIDTIIKKRPYTSLGNFMSKVNPNKQAMIALIKGGAFDQFDERKRVMLEYVWMTCGKKKRITLQNMSGLIQKGLLPDCLSYEKSVYEFNRYLKNVCSDKNNTDNYVLDDRAVNFICTNYESAIEANKDEYLLSKKTWDKIYQKEMDIVRNWMKENQVETLYQLNKEIFLADWKKYAEGNYSSWEMEVLCFYYHPHELAKVNAAKFGVADFFKLPQDPVIDKIFKKKNVDIPIYRLTKIMGTCIAKDKVRATVSLLTPSGVVTLKFRNEYFSLFDKQISAKDSSGIKHVIEKSWFNRGNMIMVTGMRREDEFVPKKYAATVGPQLYKIDSITSNGDLILRTERAKGED